MKVIDRICKNDSNNKIVQGLITQLHDWLLLNNLFDNAMPCDILDWYEEALKGSVLLNSLLPQQRKPFIKQLADRAYRELFLEC